MREKCFYCGGNTFNDMIGNCRACGAPRRAVVHKSYPRPSGTPVIESPVMQAADEHIPWSFDFRYIPGATCTRARVYNKREPSRHKNVSFTVNNNLVTLDPLSGLCSGETYILSIATLHNGRFYCELKVI